MEAKVLCKRNQIEHTGVDLQNGFKCFVTGRDPIVSGLNYE